MHVQAGIVRATVHLGGKDRLGLSLQAIVFCLWIELGTPTLIAMYGILTLCSVTITGHVEFSPWRIEREA